MWIPKKDVNRRRSQGDQPTSPKGAQASLRLNRFPKSARILKKGHFRAVYRERSRFFGDVLAVDYRTSKIPHPLLGLAVSKKFGNAVARNRFKRLVREAFRTNRARLVQGLEMVVMPRSGIETASLEEITRDLLTLSNRIMTRDHAQSPATTSR